MEKIVAKIKKSMTSEIVVSLSDYTGEPKLSIREYFLADESGAFHPTKKGISSQSMRSRG